MIIPVRSRDREGIPSRKNDTRYDTMCKYLKLCHQNIMYYCIVISYM